MSMRKLLANNEGMIALVVTVMITSFTLIYGLSVALMTLDELQASSAWLYVGKADSQASACVSEALIKLVNNANFTGNVNLSISNVNCKSTVTNPGGNIRTIVANATSTDPFSRSIVGRTSTNINVNTAPFTTVQYKDILE